MDNLTCKICDNEYSGRPNTRYCSDECRAMYNAMRSKQYRKEHPEYVARELVRLEKWKKENKQHAEIARKIIRSKRRKGQRGSGTLTASEWKETMEFFTGCCAYCEEPLGEEYHKDHFFPFCDGGEFTKSNIVPSCPKCNQLKGAAHPRDFCEEDTWLRITNRIGYMT